MMTTGAAGTTIVHDVFLILLGIALDAGGRIGWEWWCAYQERRNPQPKRKRVRQDDYYTPCGDGCRIR